MIFRRHMSWLAQKSSTERWKNDTEWKYINCKPVLFVLDVFRMFNCIHEQLLNFSSIPKWQTSMGRPHNKFMEMRSATSEMHWSILLDQQIACASAKHLHEKAPVALLLSQRWSKTLIMILSANCNLYSFCISKSF